MKPGLKNTLQIVLCACILLAGACDDDDESSPQLTGDTKTYTLNSVSDPAISGTVTFAERDDDQIVITIELDGTQPGVSHPAHIHMNTAAEGGGIILDLTSVDGATGMSETIVSALNDGSVVSYDDLLSLNGHVNVHESAANLSTLIAQGDIGKNELTGDRKEYTLQEVEGSGVSGTAVFERRVSDFTLVTLQLTGTQSGGDHPAHIHNNDAAMGGGIAIDLSNVNGDTGLSVTHIEAMNDGTPIMYDQLVTFNGHINVHLSPSQLATVVARGNVGANAGE
jgi:hypothetical protein